MLIGKLGALQGSSKVAAFDMDWTLVRTKSGNTFPNNINDWDWWHSSVRPRLHKLVEEGFRIVVFTNQGGV